MDEAGQILSLVGGAGEAVLDRAWAGLTRLLDLGGPVVALLLTLSVFALAVMLVKLWQFAATGTPRAGLMEAVRLWRDGEYALAATHAELLGGPVARVVAHAMRASGEGRSQAHVREEAENLARMELAAMRSYLRGLEAVVQVAPLLGLFGTVLGMIEAFRALEAAGARVDPADLAGGIWVALLTTAVGLAIAMPVALVLHWLESRIERQRQTMEWFVTGVLTWPAEIGLAARVERDDMAPVDLAAAREERHAP